MTICLFAQQKVLCRFLLSVFFIYGLDAHVAADEYIGPDTLVASKDGKLLYAACEDSEAVVVADVAKGTVIEKICLPARPTGMALTPDGTKLYVTCAGPLGTICVVNTSANEIDDVIPAGLEPIAPVIVPGCKRLFVCDRFESRVSVIDLDSAIETTSTPVPREPYAAAATPDGKTVFVADLLPLDRADGNNVAAVIVAVDTTAGRPTIIRLPNGSINVRGLSISPDGKYVFAVHMLARYQLPTTQLDRGWVSTSALSIIDSVTKKLINTVSLSDVDHGAADPWGIATTADGKWICITHAGTHELSLINASGLMEKLATRGSAADVANDLGFLAHLRRRVKLEGNGSHGMAVIGTRAYVSEYFSDTIAVVDLQSVPPEAIGSIRLGPKPNLTAQRRGKLLFNDATMSFQHWQSCATCHPDARTDGVNWDLLNDGLGNPKNTRSLIHVHESGAVMALAVRDTAKAAIDAGIARVMFAERPDADSDAIDEYLSSLRPVPSPRLVDGKLSVAAQRGKRIFFDRNVGCARCHPPPYYTDKRAHDVGSAGPSDQPGDRFQTPRLTELWRTAPYMHDGHYVTVKELFDKGQHGAIGGNISRLTDKDIDDLTEFLLSL
jgi:DNA-binding beta-propeller fold protein YncE